MKGAKPELEQIWGDLWFVCGYCNDPIYKIKDSAHGYAKFCPNYCPHCGGKVDKACETVKVTDAIRQGVEEYHKRYLDSPDVVYMSPFTFDTVKIETAKMMNVVATGGIDRIFGMEIKQNERLPQGVVVVGGVLVDSFNAERKTEGVV